MKLLALTLLLISALIAHLWPWAIAWLGLGFVFAVVFGALTLKQK